MPLAAASRRHLDCRGSVAARRIATIAAATAAVAAVCSQWRALRPHAPAFAVHCGNPNIPYEVAPAEGEPGVEYESWSRGWKRKVNKVKAPVVPIQSGNKEDYSKNRRPFAENRWRFVDGKWKLRRGARWYGKHPNPQAPEERPQLIIPGGVERKTVREAKLVKRLRSGEDVPAEELDRCVQVFGMRAQQTDRWIPIQRKEFKRRAWLWARRMKDRNMEPSFFSIRVLIQACSAVGDLAGTRGWIAELQSADEPMLLSDYVALARVTAKNSRPHQVLAIMSDMEKAGTKPDARVWTALMRSWYHLGNRGEMLRTLKRYQEARAAGDVIRVAGDEDGADEAEPYVVAAESFANVGDVRRTEALLRKIVDEVGELGPSALLARLEAHVRTSPLRRRLQDVENALQESVAAAPLGQPLFASSEIPNLVKRIIGPPRYYEILEEQDTVEEALMPPQVDPEEYRNWHLAKWQEIREMDHDTARKRRHFLHWKQRPVWRPKKPLMKVGKVSPNGLLYRPKSALWNGPEWMRIQEAKDETDYNPPVHPPKRIMWTRPKALPLSEERTPRYRLKVPVPELPPAKKGGRGKVLVDPRGGGW